MRLLLWVLLVLCTPDILVAQQQPYVVATTGVLAHLAQQVAGPRLQVHSLLPPGTDPHTYEPVPETRRMIDRADLILTNGLTLEGWLDRLINNSPAADKVVLLTHSILPIRSALHYGAADPHAWMDPTLAKVYCRNACTAFEQLDPAHAAEYRARLEAYSRRLDTLDGWIRDQITTLPMQGRVLITTHDAFSYYARQYGLQVEPLMGTTTDADVRPADLKRVGRIVELRGVKAVFAEAGLNPKFMQQLARHYGVVRGQPLYADNLGPSGSGAEDYIGMMEHNTRAIVQGLSSTGPTAPEPQGKLLWLVAIAAIMLLCAALLARYLRVRDKGPLPPVFELEVAGVSVAYQGKTANSNVYLRLQQGRVYGLVGANGSGKSTLLKAILGLVQPEVGTIQLAGHPIQHHRSRIAYIPQKEDIDWRFPATVLDVVRMGRYPHLPPLRPLSRADEELARHALRQVELEHLAGRQISELSGGQQQRTFIARALCQQADVYLMDEPFVGVDMATEEHIMQLIKALAVQGKLLLIIHHDLTKAPQYFDEVILFNQQVVAQGPPAQVMTAENMHRTFGGRLNLLHYDR